MRHRGLYRRPDAGTSQELGEIAGSMNGSLHYRGPDDAGVWIDAEAGVALAHRRLSIIDLSPAGDQPMVSADGRYVIIYNGEVYNHEDMRPSLSRASRFAAIPTPK